MCASARREDWRRRQAAARQAHLEAPLTARFCRLTRNNACNDLHRLWALAGEAQDTA